MATAAAGLTTRTDTCEKHNREYPQVLFPRSGQQPAFWAGNCPECLSEENLLLRANELLATPARQAELLARVERQEAASEQEIQTEIDRAMEAERIVRRSEWEELVRSQLKEELALRVQAEMRTEIISGLKSQAVPQTAAERG